MKRILPIMLAAVIIGAAGFMAIAPAKAYYVQPYMPTYYSGYGYQQPDMVSGLTQSNLNWVSTFTYVPQPVPLYFYNPPMPFAYPYSTYSYWW